MGGHGECKLMTKGRAGTEVRREGVKGWARGGHEGRREGTKVRRRRVGERKKVLVKEEGGGLRG